MIALRTSLVGFCELGVEGRNAGTGVSGVLTHPELPSHQDEAGGTFTIIDDFLGATEWLWTSRRYSLEVLDKMISVGSQL